MQQPKQIDLIKQLLDQIIEKSFPELLADDIQLEFKKHEDAVIYVGEFHEEGFYIELDTVLQTAPNIVLIGGLAHELVHIIKDYKERKGFFFELVYKFSKRFREAIERETDLEVILRGFGKELLEFLLYCEEYDYPHYREDGLSIREIKILMKQD